MTRGDLLWGAPAWLPVVAGLGLVAFLTITVCYLRTPGRPGLRLLLALLKSLGVTALLACLLEPLWSGVRPRPGANLFVLLADNSRSMTLRDQGSRRTRGERVRDDLDANSSWQTRLAQDFDVRRYIFDSRLRSLTDFSALSFEDASSTLATSLDTLSQRFRERPLAGVLVWTDGNATDVADAARDWSGLPPIYPVVAGGSVPPRDVVVERLTVTETNFETAPVTVNAEVRTIGYRRQPIVVELLDDRGATIDKQVFESDDTPVKVSFRFRPEGLGIHFYRVRAGAEKERRQFELPDTSREATLANNSRLLLVDRGGGPYRLLYVAGRPNWEFKFLRRSLATDEELRLIGLIRIAKREPKFDFRSRRGESTNPLFRGFGNEQDEEAERYDEPVLLRFGVEGDEQLRDGFPKSAGDLFAYHALIIDDLEAAFFTQDQMSLIQRFVSERGGGLIMLGGPGSFQSGKYDRTPIGELLPVYLDQALSDVPAQDYRFSLTREGQHPPWSFIRVRGTIEEEQRQLAEKPAHASLNRVRAVKPGATILARATGPDGTSYPALVAQSFGKGRTASLMAGDMWKWSMHRREDDEPDLERAWRQTMRWLVADVPQRIEIRTRRRTDLPQQPVELRVVARDEEFQPLDNAEVKIRIEPPQGAAVDLAGQPDETTAGVYVATYVPRHDGGYRATAEVLAADGSRIGERQAGWIAEPDLEEFSRLEPGRELLQQIARSTGGELVDAEALDRFVSDLPNKRIPVTEPWVFPLWHQWSVFALAMVCLVGEWGLRRLRGLP